MIVVWSRPPRALADSFVAESGEFAGEVDGHRAGGDDRLAAGAAFQHFLRHAVVFGDDCEDVADGGPAGGAAGQQLLDAHGSSLPIGSREFAAEFEQGAEHVARGAA